MAYNHGKAERKWRLWKEAEEKLLRANGVEESSIELLYTYDRAEFNSDRRFYRYLNDVAEYLEEMFDIEPPKAVNTVTDLLNEIENENLYRALLASVYKGILNKNSIMDCQPTEFTALTRLRGGFFMGQRKEVSLPRGLTKKVRPFFHAIK